MWSSDPAERAKRRRELRADILAQAERKAAHLGRSLRCGEGDHRRSDATYGWIGCQNDGETCGCECHDHQRVPATAAT
jgi:hypothetical protein